MGVVLESQDSKCQDLPKFQFSRGWGGGGVLESQNPSKPSVKICLNFNFQGGGVFWKVKTKSDKICLNFNFLGRGVFWKVKIQSAKICVNFNFQGGGGWEGVLESQNPKCQDLPKFQFGRGVCSGKSRLKVPKSA